MTVDITTDPPAQLTAPRATTGTLGELDVDMVAALCRASTRRGFNPFIDIDWDAPENLLDANDPRWQLDPAVAPLATTSWYAQQPLQRRIEMSRWITANILKVTLQF